MLKFQAYLRLLTVFFLSSSSICFLSFFFGVLMFSSFISNFFSEFNSFDVAKQSRQVVDELLDKMAQDSNNATDFIDKISDETDDLSTKIFPTSQSAIKNGRKTMEDRHVIISDLNKIMDLKVNVMNYIFFSFFLSLFSLLLLFFFFFFFFFHYNLWKNHFSFFFIFGRRF